MRPPLVFPYVKETYIDPISKKGKELFRPKVPIVFGYNHKITPYPLNCLVDTGSDFNLFPAAIAEYLGINVKNGKIRKIYGIGKANLDAYRHLIEIYLEKHKISTHADFTYEQRLPLLGRTGFLSYFRQVIFKEKEKLTELYF